MELWICLTVMIYQQWNCSPIICLLYTHTNYKIMTLGHDATSNFKLYTKYINLPISVHEFCNLISQTHQK